MLPSSSRLRTAGSPPRRLVRHALYLGGALILLWVMVQVTALVPSASASGQDAETDGHEVTVSSSSTSSSGVDVFTWGNATAMLLLLGGGGYAYYLNRPGPTTTGDAVFRPLGQFALGQSQQLRLVACGDEVLLLGVTDNDVTLLKTYSDEAFDDHPTFAEEEKRTSDGTSIPTPTAVSGDFSDVMSRFVRQNGSS